MGSHHPIRKTVAPEPTVIPDKLYFRIGDVARLCQVPAYVLRFWETEFPSLKPNKGGTGQRLYRKRDVEMALRIKTLLYDQGYTIPGARQVFKAEGRPHELSAATAFPEAQAQVSPAQLSAAPPSAAPSSAAPSGAANAPADVGEEIRLRAQQRPHLRALRTDLLALLAQLSGPVGHSDAATSSAAAAGSGGAATSAPDTIAAGLRPRLVLEPRQASRAHPHTPKPQELERQQRDLFGSDTQENTAAPEPSE